MKTHLLTSLLCLPALLSAEPALKLELAGPNEPVKISQNILDQAAALPAALKELERLQAQPEPDMAAFAKLEKTLDGGRRLKQDITLRVRFTNTGKAPVDLQYGPDVSQNHLTVEGPGAVALPFMGATTMEFRMPNPTRIGPGETKEFTIQGLAQGHRDLSRWLVSQAGTYSATLKFTTTLNEEEVELTSNKVTFEVKAE
ncbi:MAG: hypothetical protein ACKO2G_04410 [Verrucomicrobiales bacterium]